MDVPSSADPPVEHPQTPSNINYAFLNHSATTLPHNLPPSVDDRPSARHKRKRTSPEDQAILEAAYKRDPKPDKPARLELVKQVSLGEKEVQIWFQNRRQSSRRKSRPLLPHEIAQYQLSRTGGSSSPVVSDAAAYFHDDDPTSGAPGGSDEEIEDTSRHDIGREHATLHGEVVGERQPAQPLESARPHPAAGVTSQRDSHAPTNDVSTALPQPISIINFPTTPAEGRQQLGYLANRRSASSFRLDSIQDADRDATQQTVAADNTGSSSRLKKSSSFVRLSMSVDGNASVITKDGSSPSPPRASQVSMIPVNDTPSQQMPSSQPESVAARSGLQRSSSGRSRDSRAWEFWCDKDARAELEEKAEKDASGSAADAIGLLRSASGRSILGSIPAKRNSILSRQPGDAKRPRLQATAPALQKSSTSSGRLQGRIQAKPRPKLMYSGSAVSVHIPGNESDKENWSPDRETTISDKDKSSDPQDPPRTALGDGQKQSNRGPQSTSITRTAKMNAGRAAADSENVDPDSDPEVSAFMHSGRKSNSTSSEDELDCVQGLLSLSQGNWQ